MRRHAASLDADTFNNFFMPHEVGGEQGRDTITNEELTKEEQAAKIKNDRDGDGILNKDDACPDEAGVESMNPYLNGCPEK